MQGLQPSPNSTPSSGAPARPARGRTEGLTIRPARANRSRTPANSRPSAIVSAPSTSVRPWWCDFSAVPALPNASPYEVYRAENPSTNSAVPAITRLRGGAGPPAEPVPARAGRAAAADWALDMAAAAWTFEVAAAAWAPDVAAAAWAPAGWTVFDWAPAGSVVSGPAAAPDMPVT